MGDWGEKETIARENHGSHNESPPVARPRKCLVQVVLLRVTFIEKRNIEKQIV